MTGKLHRAITQVAQAVVIIGGIVVVTDPSTLGVGSDMWNLIGGWCAFGGGVLTVVATIIRGDQIPGITTGIGNEPAGVTETTTISTTTQPT